MNQFYTAYKTNMLGSGTRIVPLTDTINVVLVDTSLYTVSIGTHDALNDIPSGARTATATLTSKSITAGVFDSGDPIFVAATGATSEALVLYKDTGTESTSLLIAYYDTGFNLPVILDGSDIEVSIPAGGWFSV